MKKYLLTGAIVTASIVGLDYIHQSTQRKMPPMGPVYEIQIPEGFTPSHWSKGEGINSYTNGWERYQMLNGKGHMPKAHRSVLLSDDNQDGLVARMPVSEAKKVDESLLAQIINENSKKLK